MRKLLPAPCTAEQVAYSMLFSMHDQPGEPSPALQDTALQICQRAAQLKERGFSTRLKSAPEFVQTWPGEHYFFLAAMTDFLQPKLVVEIGTGTGLSALAMLERLPPESRLVTYDIVPWNQYPDPTFLREEDFTSGRLSQRQDDLADPSRWEANREVLQGASVVFIDGPKDGEWEDRLIPLMDASPWFKPPLVVFDDIRLWEMLRTWRNIRHPKLDLASFGHFTGTGLVEWDARS